MASLSSLIKPWGYLIR